MASFQAKIWWGRLRKRENKKKSFRWVLTRPVIENSKKIAKNFEKLKKHHYGFFSSQNRLGKTKKERKLEKSFLWVPTRPVIENSKNKKAKKLKKLKKQHYGIILSQNKLGNAEKERR